MNERIKELARQADEYASQFAYVQAVGHPGYKEKFNEKFAELIVKECIRHFNEDYQRDWDKLWREDLTHSIKQHFGIK